MHLSVNLLAENWTQWYQRGQHTEPLSFLLNILVLQLNEISHTSLLEPTKLVASGVQWVWSKQQRNNKGSFFGIPALCFQLFFTEEACVHPRLKETPSPPLPPPQQSPHSLGHLCMRNITKPFFLWIDPRVKLTERGTNTKKWINKTLGLFYLSRTCGAAGCVTDITWVLTSGFTRGQHEPVQNERAESVFAVLTVWTSNTRHTHAVLFVEWFLRFKLYSFCCILLPQGKGGSIRLVLRCSWWFDFYCCFFVSELAVFFAVLESVFVFGLVNC